MGAPTRSARGVIRFLTALFLVTLAVPARADVPPLPTSPDAHCSLAEQCAHGVLCPYARRPGTPPPAVPVGQACRTDALGKGLERRCRHGGNYSGEELYCPKGETGSWAPPGPATAPPATTGAPATASAASAVDTGSPAAPKSSSRCSAAPLADGSPLPFVAALLALGARARRHAARRKNF